MEKDQQAFQNNKHAQGSIDTHVHIVFELFLHFWNHLMIICYLNGKTRQILSFAFAFIFLIVFFLTCTFSWVCLVWRKGGWGVTSLLSATTWAGDVERQVLITSPWYPSIGHVGMVQSWTIQGRFRLDIRKHFFSLPRGWSNTRTGFLERWSTSQACQCLDNA